MQWSWWVFKFICSGATCLVPVSLWLYDLIFVHSTHELYWFFKICLLGVLTTTPSPNVFVFMSYFSSLLTSGEVNWHHEIKAVRWLGWWTVRAVALGFIWAWAPALSPDSFVVPTQVKSPVSFFPMCKYGTYTVKIWGCNWDTCWKCSPHYGSPQACHEMRCSRALCSGQRKHKWGPAHQVMAMGYTLLSPPETARMLAVMDQLTCHTTSLNLCSSLGDHVLLEASSQVQMNTRPSWEDRVRRWGQGSCLEPYWTFAGIGWGIQRKAYTWTSWVSTALRANLQPSTLALIPFPQEYISHRSRISQVPFFLLVSGMHFVCIANSQISSGLFLMSTKSLPVSAPSGSVYPFSTEWVWLSKSQAQRIRRETKTKANKQKNQTTSLSDLGLNKTGTNDVKVLAAWLNSCPGCW